MDILPSEEEQMVKNAAREFLEAECPPSLAREMEKDELGYPPDLWNQLAELGWFGISLPEEYGGQGLPLTYLGIILEEVGRAIAPVPFHSTIVPALTIAREGTEEQRQELLPRVSRGDLIMTWAFQEQDPRLLPEAVNTEAVPDGDQFVISGVKMFVDNFNAAEKCLVACRTSPASAEGKGISLFLVDTSSPGISQTPLTTLAKDKQSKIEFNHVRVPRKSLMGQLNQGWPIAQNMLDRATVLLCAQIVGAARKDAEMAVEYSKNRVAFGRPIGAFQSIQHLCADMLVWVDGAQLLTYEALWKMDQGLPAGVEVSQAKAFCNDKCQAVVRSSQIIHGGIGFMMEFDLHLWYRRVCAWTMRLGTSFEHRARIARALLDQPGQVRLGIPLTPVS
jgi:alkylation response protein AidB-like acyl-CoA dehydrogenase